MRKLHPVVRQQPSALSNLGFVMSQRALAPGYVLGKPGASALRLTGSTLRFGDHKALVRWRCIGGGVPGACFARDCRGLKNGVP